MAKLPKMSELSSSMPGVFNKFKTMYDSLMGPGTSEATEAALAHESDPVKRKLLEIELLINQLRDVQLIQNKSLDALKVKFGECQRQIITELQPKEVPTPTVGAVVEPPTEIPKSATPVSPVASHENHRPAEPASKGHEAKNK